MKLPIYMDYQATTPVDPRVLTEMTPYFTEIFGNPHSKSHVFGVAAEEAVEAARKKIADLLHATGKEIIFTSGATESNNLAIKGVAFFYREKGNHIITSQIEHPSVLDTCKYLERLGFEITYLPVSRDGLIDLEELKKAIKKETILISIMFANNEIGTIQEVAEIGKIAKERGKKFHTDAAQAFGKVPIDVHKMGIDLLSFSAHKMYGPKGVGVLYVRHKNPEVLLTAQVHGGGHENGLRSGTLNVPGIVGLGKACEIALAEMNEEGQRLTFLREKLKDGLMRELSEVYLNGHPTKRLPGNLNLSFASVDSESLLLSLSDIALSTGSACTTKSVEPSHVLSAIGVRKDLAHSALRFGLGRFTTEEEVDYVIRRVNETVKKLRVFVIRK